MNRIIVILLLIRKLLYVNNYILIGMNRNDIPNFYNGKSVGIDMFIINKKKTEKDNINDLIAEAKKLTNK